MDVTTEIPTYQQRVIEEYQQLDARLDALHAFFGDREKCKKVSHEALRLMLDQSVAMRQYLEILAERTYLFDQDGV